MTITNNYLYEIAKAIKGDASETVGYMGFGTGTTSSIALTATGLTGEIGDRTPLTASRTQNAITWTGLRSSTDVVGTAGDDLTNVGTFNASTGGNLQMGQIVAGILHTTAFDVDIELTLTVNRA